MRYRFELNSSKAVLDVSGRSQIYLCIGYGEKKPVMIFTGERCLKNNWIKTGTKDNDGKKGNKIYRVSNKEPLHQNINAKLSLIETWYASLESYFKVSNIQPTNESIRKQYDIISGHTKEETKAIVVDEFWTLYQKFLDDIQNGVIKHPKTNKPLTDATLQAHTAARNHLLNFEKKKSYKMTFAGIDEIWYDKFTSYLWDDKDLNHYDNTVGKYIRLFKGFLNWSKKTDQQKNRWFKIWDEEKDILVLDPFQLNLLIDAEINLETVTKWCVRIERVIQKESILATVQMIDETRDRFALGASIAQRVSDMLKLKPVTNLVQAGDGAYKIKLRSKKTSTYTFIDLADYASLIIEKYKGKYDTIVPPISDQRFNDNLKVLGSFLGWDKIEVSVIRHKRGEPVETIIKMSDLLTSHVMRYTGITTLLIAGMPELMVKLISGHAKNSRSFERYVSFAAQFINHEYKAAWNRIRKGDFTNPYLKVV